MIIFTQIINKETACDEVISATEEITFKVDDDVTYEKLVDSFRQFSLAVGYSLETIKTYIGDY